MIERFMLHCANILKYAQRAERMPKNYVSECHVLVALAVYVAAYMSKTSRIHLMCRT